MCAYMYIYVPIYYFAKVYDGDDDYLFFIYIVRIIYLGVHEIRKTTKEF